MNEKDGTVYYCKQCILHSKVPRIVINESGICSECSYYMENKSVENRMKQLYLSRMERLFATAKANNQCYDALMLLSGGKDSFFVLKMLKEKYGINPLAISIIHPLINATAARNIEKVAAKLKVDLIKYYIQEDVYKAVIKESLINRSKYDLGEFVGCDVCGFIYTWIPVKIAIQMRIPVILLGDDSTQSVWPSIWNPQSIKDGAKRDVKMFGKMHDLFADVLGDKYPKSIYYYDKEEMVNRDLPHIISPLSFIEYNYQQLIDSIKTLGLNPGDFSPIKTNCDARPFFSYHALKIYGCVAYVRQIANEIRKGGYSNFKKFVLTSKPNINVVNRDELLVLLQEYESIINYIVDNKITKKNLSSQDILRMQKLAPCYIKFAGLNKNYVLLLNDLLMINEYFKYFDLSELSDGVDSSPVSKVSTV